MRGRCTYIDARILNSLINGPESRQFNHLAGVFHHHAGASGTVEIHSFGESLQSDRLNRRKGTLGSKDIQ